MDKDPLAVGVIGCGRIARRVHLETLGSLSGVAVTAVADPDESARNAARARFPGARACAAAEDVIGDAAVDAVVVCVPSGLHAQVAEMAFGAGKHVYLEKPVATELADAARVARAWRASGRTGMVGLNYRHDPRYQALRARIQAGEMGPVVAARTVFCSSDLETPEWKRSRASGGGVLLDLASHHADLARFVFGEEVALVSATLHSVASEGDTAGVRMVLESGIPIESLFSLRAPDDDRFEVYGRDLRLTVDRFRSPDLEHQAAGYGYGHASQLRRELGSALRGVGRVVRATSEPSFRLALEAFVAAARGGRPAGPDVDDGIRSLEIVLAAEESARCGRSVRPGAMAQA